MTRITKLLILILIVVSILACGVKLPTGGEGVNTATPTTTEPDEALSSLRDVPTVTPIPLPVIVDSGGEKGLP